MLRDNSHHNRFVSSAALAAAGITRQTPDPSPWPAIQGLVTRRDPTGRVPGVHWPEQALDLEQALRYYTINAGQAIGLADVTGSIEVGKSADLAVLDRHLFDTPAEQLGQTRVLATWFEGRLVHEARTA